MGLEGESVFEGSEAGENLLGSEKGERSAPGSIQAWVRQEDYVGASGLYNFKMLFTNISATSWS